MKKNASNAGKKVKPNSDKLLDKLRGHVEITPEQRVARDADIWFIFQQTKDDETQAKLRKDQKAAEIVELLGGTITTRGALEALVTPSPSPYVALFPNTLPFWEQIFKLNDWNELDPAKFVKPRIVGRWVCELIYNRFRKEVLPAIRKLNPFLTKGFRLRKHFQYLTPEAKAMLIQYRDEAVALMLTSSNWTEFRKKYLAQYGIGFQPSVFDEA